MMIGILTTFFSKNYGAVLQAYATAKTIELLGHDYELINYQNSEKEYYVTEVARKEQSELSIIQKVYLKARNAFIKTKRPNKALIVGSMIRDNEFDGFVRSFLKVGNTTYSSSAEFINAVPNMSYDVFLCGSDQIWNPIVHNFDDVYYLNFPTKAKKVSYASSVAYNRFSKSEILRICDAIKSIDCISVREKSTAACLQPYLEKKVHYVIDPTFLLDKNDWLKLTSIKKFDGKYILVYLLNYNEQNKNIVSLISDMARKNGLKIICLPYTSIKLPKDIETEYRYDIAPNDFIQLLNDAECVVTNSFHATALSINLNIPFYVVSSRERNKDLQTRLSDLLEETKLEERKIYPDTSSLCLDDKIDFESVNTIIENRRNEGIEYLQQSLEMDATI